ncbi:ABC transporter permease [Castellaniella sp.]|uniref:ABC transporter permease n=1 Tax=Castellaniella sp. TaxID=1955812 RepID=UPI003561DC71
MLDQGFRRWFKPSQELVVTGLLVALFLLFSILLPGFLEANNLVNLIQNVSIIGILALGMGFVVIGKGIDLAMVATMAITAAWTVLLLGDGVPSVAAVLLGLLLAVGIGLLSGFLIAYVEISSLFTTLAMISVIYGFGQLALVHSDLTYVPDAITWIPMLNHKVFGIPLSVIWFGLIAFLMSIVLRYTKIGRYIYFIGDNYQAARVTGLPVRPIILIQYCGSAVIAYVTGIIGASVLNTVNTRVVNSTLIYDVILVVVLGGISLSGGKGRVMNIIVATLLIGILLNGLTIMNVPFTVQNLLEGALLLVALVIDSILNPRDEQTAQQGDI